MKLFNKTLATTLAIQLATAGAFAQSAQLNDAERIQKTEAQLNAKKDELIKALTTTSNQAIEITKSESKKVATYAELRNYELLYAQLWRASLVPKLPYPETRSQQENASVPTASWFAVDTALVTLLIKLSNRVLVQPGKALGVKAASSVTKEVAEVAVKDAASGAARRISLRLARGIKVTLLIALLYDMGQQSYIWMQLTEKDLNVVRAETFAKIQSLQAELNAMK